MRIKEQETRLTLHEHDDDDGDDDDDDDDDDDYDDDLSELHWQPTVLSIKAASFTHENRSHPILS